MKLSIKQKEIINDIRASQEERDYWMYGWQNNEDGKKSVLNFMYTGDRRKHLPDIDIVIKW